MAVKLGASDAEFWVTSNRLSLCFVSGSKSRRLCGCCGGDSVGLCWATEMTDKAENKKASEKNHRPTAATTATRFGGV